MHTHEEVFETNKSNNNIGNTQFFFGKISKDSTTVITPSNTKPTEKNTIDTFANKFFLNRLSPRKPKPKEVIKAIKDNTLLTIDINEDKKSNDKEDKSTKKQIEKLDEQIKTVKKELNRLKEETLYEKLQNECEIETISGRMKLKQTKIDNNLNSSVIRQKMNQFPLSLYTRSIENTRTNNNIADEKKNENSDDDEIMSTSSTKVRRRNSLYSQEQLQQKRNEMLNLERRKIIQLEGQLCRSYHHLSIICKQISLHEKYSYGCGEDYLEEIKARMSTEQKQADYLLHKKIHLTKEEINFIEESYTSLINKTSSIQQKCKVKQEKEIYEILQEQEEEFGRSSCSCDYVEETKDKEGEEIELMRGSAC